MNQVFLLLGANLGDPIQQLNEALQNIQSEIGPIVSRSSIYTSEAWGVTDQPTFLNQAIGLETLLSPLEVLNATQKIENKLGRVRLSKWGARVIDIDILYFNDIIHEDERLTIPHPLIQERNFVLIPLNEIAPNNIHPKLQTSNHDLLLSCTDTLKVTIQLSE